VLRVSGRRGFGQTGEDEPQLVGAQRPVLVAESEANLEPWVARQALQVCAEPIINGEPLIDMLARVEGRPAGYAAAYTESPRHAA
jgi:hypothetical protein